jgi:hypothetical protein
MYYVIPHDISLMQAFTKGQFSTFNDLESAKQFADTLKNDTGLHRSVVKVEWVTGTQTLADLKRYPSIQGPMGWVD